jgi:membrane-associated phospholipid phosphatase
MPGLAELFWEFKHSCLQGNDPERIQRDEGFALKCDPVFQHLLRKSLAALVLCVVLVALCYFFVDRPVSFFVQGHHFSRHALLKWLTYPPPILQDWVPVVLIALVVRRSWGAFTRWERTLLAACISLLVTVQFKDTLKYVFGRDWPDTWIEHNPSLIRDGAYGFHFFQGSEVYGSFPSGHTARTLAIAAVVWVAYPTWRWACVTADLAIAIGLIGMDYHFVGDVIAGGVLGGLVGVYTAYFFGLEPKTDEPRAVP